MFSIQFLATVAASIPFNTNFSEPYLEYVEKAPKSMEFTIDEHRGFGEFRRIPTFDDFRCPSPIFPENHEHRPRKCDYDVTKFSIGNIGIPVVSPCGRRISVVKRLYGIDFETFARNCEVFGKIGNISNSGYHYNEALRCFIRRISETDFEAHFDLPRYADVDLVSHVVLIPGVKKQEIFLAAYKYDRCCDKFVPYH